MSSVVSPVRVGELIALLRQLEFQDAEILPSLQLDAMILLRRYDADGCVEENHFCDSSDE